MEPVPVTQLFGILLAGIRESSLNARLVPEIQITTRDIIDIVAIVIPLMIFSLSHFAFMPCESHLPGCLDFQTVSKSERNQAGLQL